MSLTQNALDTTTSKYRFLNDDFILCSFIYSTAWRGIFALGVFPDHVKIDVARLFPASGHLVQVLPEYYQPANVWAVYVSRLAMSAKVRITVEFLRQYFAEHYPNFSLEYA
ncbi:TPA: LysR family transcriptional regulator [Escherichia coli]|nr:LysR family transcriptional regulator [Escherichia coli]